MKKRAFYLILFITSVIVFSCQDYLTVEPEDSIPVNQVFKTADNAISAVYGLYGLMQPCVDQIFLAGDVQSDLVVAARGADQYIAEIAQNRVSPTNPYTDYSNFYRLIVACNTTIAGLEEIERLDPVNYTPEKRNFNTAEIICIRAWAYLQLVKIWGDVPYYENSITDLSQVVDLAPTPGAVILATIEKEVSEQANPIMQTTLGTSNTLLYAQFQNMNTPVLLQEIDLFLGNYIKSANWVNKFVPYGAEATQYFGAKRAAAPNFINNFRWNSGTDWSGSVFMAIPFDGSKGQKNNLMRWTNNINGGIYAIKPSTVAINKWDTQINFGTDNMDAAGVSQNWDGNGMPIPKGTGDFRGSGVSYYVNGSDTLISKYLLKSGSFQTVNGEKKVVGVMKVPTQNDPETNDDTNFVLFRDGISFLNVSEAWNSMGLSNMAIYPLNGLSSNNTIMRGVRKRGCVMPRVFNYSKGDLYQQMEDFMLDEYALEAAFEGNRWFTLVRFAKRANDPALLARIVAAKYPSVQRAEIIARLSDPNRHYWPYYYKNVAANKLLKQKPGYQ